MSESKCECGLPLFVNTDGHFGCKECDSWTMKFLDDAAMVEEDKEDEEENESGKEFLAKHIGFARMQDGIDHLAKVISNGQLLAETDPAQFLHNAAEEIKRLQELVEQADKEETRLREMATNFKEAAIRAEDEAERLRSRLEFSPQGDDKIDELEQAIQFCKDETNQERERANRTEVERDTVTDNFMEAALVWGDLAGEYLIRAEAAQAALVKQKKLTDHYRRMADSFGSCPNLRD